MLYEGRNDDFFIKNRNTMWITAIWEEYLSCIRGQRKEQGIAIGRKCLLPFKESYGRGGPGWLLLITFTGGLRVRRISWRFTNGCIRNGFLLRVDVLRTGAPVV
jgi:hypothetical protein